MKNVWLSLVIMILSVYAVRVLPLMFLRRPIRSRFIRSFLHYVPYVTLAVMTFPSIVTATGSYAAGALSLVAGLLAAWFLGDLFVVAIVCCATVFIAGFFF